MGTKIQPSGFVFFPNMSSFLFFWERKFPCICRNILTKKLSLFFVYVIHVLVWIELARDERDFPSICTYPLCAGWVCVGVLYDFFFFLESAWVVFQYWDGVLVTFFVVIFVIYVTFDMSCSPPLGRIFILFANEMWYCNFKRRIVKFRWDTSCFLRWRD